MGATEESADREVGTEFIAAHLGDPLTRIVEVDVSPAAYTSGHIPEAILWNAYADLRHDDYRRVTDQELEALLRRSGISPQTNVVTYGYGAHLGYWLLRSFGHQRVALMDGPRDQWLSAGHDWSVDTPTHPESRYELAGQDQFAASRDDVVAAAASADAVLLDVRTEAEFTGINFWPSGAPEAVGRPGRIPGATHLPVTSLRTAEGRFVDTKTMASELSARGLAPSTEIVVYCTIGNRASQVWYALTHLLGYENVRVFADSWVEWGMDPAMPIER